MKDIKRDQAAHGRFIRGCHQGYDRAQRGIAASLIEWEQARRSAAALLSEHRRNRDARAVEALMQERVLANRMLVDALARKARAGHVTGGVVFGYRNREVVAGDGRRQYVEREINPDEAAVVRWIFELCATGVGVRRIAIRLNDEGALAPTPRRAGRPRS